MPYRPIQFFPKYQFAAAVTPAIDWFAWRPVRLWYGRWAWLETVARQRFAKKKHLDGPDWEFWSYADAAPQILRKE
jgi:hypothetical protein